MFGRRAFLGSALSAGGSILGGKAWGQEAPEAKRKVLKPVAPSSPKLPKSLEPDPKVNRLLEPLLERHQLPGLIGGFMVGEVLSSVGVVGVRKLGDSAPFRLNDLIHLGSCTKAMTATLLGMLVEEGKLKWDSRIDGIFPERAKALHPDFRSVTLIQLLNHRAGLPHDGPWWWLGRGKSTTEQRKVLLSTMLKAAPLSPPGTKYAYSNVGYAIAGLMAEQVTGKSWETLMRSRLFEPLGMSSAGFGIPGRLGSVDQPWGHRESAGRLKPVQEDNAPALGPAGTVHVSLPDWSRFVALHLQGARGESSLLKAETFRVLHTPAPGSDYAGGWVVVDQSWAGGTVLNHAGSNLTWYAMVWIAPVRNLAILTATNRGGDAAAKGCEDATRALIALSGRSVGPRPRRKSARG